MSKNAINSKKFKRFMTSNKKVLMALSISIIAILLIIVCFAIKINKNVVAWEDKIYPGVQAYGIELGDKTESEAIELLNSELINLIGEKIINVKVGDSTFQIEYSKLNPTISAEKTAQEALAYGKDQSKLKKNSLIKEKEKYEVTTEIQYNEEALKEFEQNVLQSTLVEAKDATISLSGGSFNVTPEVIGKKIDIDELHTKLIEAINPDPGSSEEISVEVKDYAPRITAEALNKIDGVIGSYTDTYVNNGTGRVTNMQLATGYVNGTLLMPGDEFSYNKTIKDTTPENGYKEANTYIGSEVVPGYGGGVCQISTALYRAVMRANIRSTIRYNHSMMVGYSEASLDATVAEGDIDYRFINTYDFPVYIQGYMTDSTIVFNVYGNKEAMGNKTYDLVNNVIETYNYSTQEVKDDTLEEGKRVTKLNGANGCKSEGYLVTYENGKEVNRELISTDVYVPMDSIVRVGTKKVENKPQEQPEKTEQPTDQPTQ